MAEIAATPAARRGRAWVILALLLSVLLIGYALVDMSTKPAGPAKVEISGISSMQAIFGGVPQEGDRLGSGDAPVSVQLFADMQCASCRDEFLAVVPGLVERRARPGEAKLLMRHYSVAENPLELGFFGAEAAAEQGYGWQFTYLFFRNQDEAGRFGIGEDFMESLAGAVGELEVEEWRDYLKRESGENGAITRRLEAYERLGTELGIRTRPAAVVSGPRGTRTLQDGPSLAQLERAIEAVE